MYGALDAKVLKVCQRGLAQHGLQATRQGSFACHGCLSRLAERETISKLPPCPSLEPLDERVGVREVIRNHKSCLRGPWVNQQVTSGQRRQRRAAATHQP